MSEFLLALLGVVVLTFVLGVFTTWAFWLCLVVAILVIVFGVIFIRVGGDGSNDWL